MSAGPGVLAIGDACERALTERFALRALALDPAVAGARGAWKGEPAVVDARAYTGGPLRYARVVRVVAGPLAIANVLGVSHHALGLPILGIDLVALGTRDAAMVAADLTPTLPAGRARDAQLAAASDLVGPDPALPPGGELPGWCREWFSPRALYVRPAAAELPVAGEALARRIAALAGLAAAATPDPARAAVVARRVDGYFQAHRTEDKGLGLLGRMFGFAWMEQFVAEILFPAVSA